MFYINYKGYPAFRSKEQIYFRDLLNLNIIPLKNTVTDNVAFALEGLLLAQGKWGLSVEQ